MGQAIDRLHFKRIRNSDQQGPVHKFKGKHPKLPGDRFLQIVVRLLRKIEFRKVDKAHGKFVGQHSVDRFPLDKPFSHELLEQLVRTYPLVVFFQNPQLLFGYETLTNNELDDESRIGHSVHPK